MRIRAITAVLATGLASLAFTPSPSPAAASNDVVHFVIDVSGSMGGDRIEQAKEAIKQTATALPDTTALGLRSYAGSCDQSGVEPLVPIGSDNDTAIQSAADSLVAGGGTPTTAALGEGLEDLRSFDTTGTRRLVLLTDGDTNCGISICDFVKSQDLTGLSLNLYAVGLQVSSGAAADLTCAAEFTGGKYIQANNPSDLADALQEASGGSGDLDGDSLPDSWEANGLKAADGTMRVDLPRLGADPRHKDVFVRIDAEAGAELTPPAKEMLISAFADMPISNPDGDPGINLHIIHGPPLNAATSDSFRKRVDGDKKAPTGVDWRAMWNYWTAQNPDQAAVYHYVASVHWDWNYLGKGSLPGQFAVVNSCTPSRSVKACPKPAFSQAMTLMHEIGHNFGLRHGGAEDFPMLKPNYLSVMNYRFAQTQQAIPGVGLTYSAWGTDDLYDLNEAYLLERDGVKAKPGALLPSGLGTIWNCNGGPIRFYSLGEPIDWNCNGRIDSQPVSAELAGADDANNHFSRSVLQPYNDLQNMLFGGGNIGFSTIDQVPDGRAEY